jgi:hypothetical protein
MFCTFNTTGSYVNGLTHCENVKFYNFGKTNDYTDETTSLFKNYNYLDGSGTAFKLRNFTGTIYCLCIAGGGGNTYNKGSSGSGGAGALLLATYNLTNVTDTVSYNVAGMTPFSKGTAIGIGDIGINGSDSTVTWVNNPSNNLTANGGSYGHQNGSNQQGLTNGNGSVGGCGRYAYANTISNQPVSSLNSIYTCYSNAGCIMENGNQYLSGGGSGAGSTASNVLSPPGQTYGSGGDGGNGMTVPAGYGISTHYYYAGGPAGGCAGAYIGTTGTGGAAGTGCTLTSSRVGTSSGYGATDNAGTNGITNYGSTATGLYTGPSAANSGSGGASGKHDGITETSGLGQGASGIIIFSLLASSM